MRWRRRVIKQFTLLHQPQGIHMKHILMVLTSHDQLGDTGHKTGFWLEEFAAPYYVFKDAGCQVTLASPAGGQPPLDPKSDAPEFQTAATHRFRADAEAVVAALAETLPLAQVRLETFDGSSTPVAMAPCGIWPKIVTRLR